MPSFKAPAKARRGKSTSQARDPASALGEVFARLKERVRAHAGFLDVQKDTAADYVLTGPMMPKWKKKLWFGGVRMGKTYVSLHLMPVYMFPGLLDGLSPEMRARMQGKSCFNFTRVEPGLLRQVDGLLADCMARLRREGVLPGGRRR